MHFVILFTLRYELTANANYAINASEGWDILCPQSLFWH